MLYSLEQFEEKLEMSVTAQRLGIKNEIPEEFGNRVIELYRTYVNISNLFIIGISDKIYITSGFRCAELNKAVCDVPGFKHCECKAFDFSFSSVVDKSDFIYVFDKFQNNVVKYLSVVGLSRDEARRQFRKHFIPNPDKLYVHFELS